MYCESVFKQEDMTPDCLACAFGMERSDWAALLDAEYKSRTCIAISLSQTHFSL